MLVQWCTHIVYERNTYYGMETSHERNTWEAVFL